MHPRTGTVGILFVTSLLLVSIRAAEGEQAGVSRPPNTFRAPIVGPLPPGSRTELHGDGRVTFRLPAPRATRVDVAIHPDPPKPMTKGASGIWTLTVGPLSPEVYVYVFIVEGVSMPDPSSPIVTVGRSGQASVIDIPGDRPRFDEPQDVPHGAWQVQEYASTALRSSRRLIVYVPPQYLEAPATQFPVLYLRHGAGGREGDWNDSGRAGTILDNLIARGAAVPMIIVLPNGHPGDGSGATAEGIAVAEKELVDDVIPLIERRYRAMSTRDGRAIAGLSMGAGQAFLTGLHHLDKFAWIGAFSSGLLSDRDFRLELGAPELVQNPAEANRRIRLLFFSCGTDDPRYAGTIDLLDALKAHQLRYDWFSTPGGHEWKVWRHSLAALLPKLFQPTMRD